ncbi:MAG: helix-hairpin-helix domain-containing protein [Lachnospiraceae bacterium]|nr:helix-hairpin-helix domain-containing protein [Lachnospiraceae bacterium]
MCRKNIIVLFSLCVLFGLTGCGEPDMVVIGSEELGSFSEADGGAADQPESGQGFGNPSVGAPKQKYIQVYVCGAVQKPGLYTVQEGSRVAVALEAAGGFSSDAGRDSINLADWLEDGQMIYFPTLTEEQEQKKETDSAEGGTVNINTANEEQLCTLPGIGASKAADIIAYRERNGRYQKPEDIMLVPGIKENLFQKIREKIRVE